MLRSVPFASVTRQILQEPQKFPDVSVGPAQVTFLYLWPQKQVF